MATDNEAGDVAGEATDNVAEKAPKKASVKPKTADADSPAAAKSSSAAAKSPKSPDKKAPEPQEPEESVRTGAPKSHVLKVHHLRPAPGAKTAKTRVGRGDGSGKGKTAGRGTKGSKARNQVPARFEGGQMPLHMRLPKRRGFTNPFRVEYQVVNLDKLTELYPAGGTVTVEDLAQRGAVRPKRLVKVLGDGEIDVAVQVSAHKFSASAVAKITAAGGTTTTL